MCKVINLFDNKNNNHEVKEESNDLGFKMSIEFDEEVVLDCIRNHGFSQAEIKTMGKYKLNCLIRDSLVHTHGWLSGFATIDDIANLSKYVRNNY
jgi:hypothetical protein